MVSSHGDVAMEFCQRLGLFQGSDKIAVIVVVNDVYTTVPLKTLGGGVKVSPVHVLTLSDSPVNVMSKAYPVGVGLSSVSDGVADGNRIRAITCSTDKPD